MFFVLVISDDEQNIIYDLYTKHHKRMLYAATQILGKERGEEAVHDVFVRIVEKYCDNSLNLGDKPGQYFVIMIRNHSINILRKEKIETISLDEEFAENIILESVQNVQFAELNPEDALIDNEATEKLAMLIRQLPPAMRQVLEYRFIEGYSNIEIAGLLGISQSAVSTAVNKARKRLKELMGIEEVTV